MLFESVRAAHKNDTLFADGLLDVGVSRFAVELGLHPGEEFALLLGNTEPFEGPFYVLRHFIPGLFRFLPALRKVVADLVENDVLEIMRGPMGGHGFLEEFFQRVLAELTDPIGLAFDVANVVDRLFVQSCAGVEFVIDIVAEVPLFAVDVQLGLCVAHGFVLFGFQAPTASASGSVAQS